MSNNNTEERMAFMELEIQQLQREAQARDRALFELQKQLDSLKEAIHTLQIQQRKNSEEIEEGIVD